MEPAPVFTTPFLDAPTCRRVRAAMDAGVVESAEILEEEIATDEDVRRASSIEVDPAMVADVERRLDERRDEVAAFFGVRLTTREGVAFLRYPAGGFYLPHVDRAVSASWPDAVRRKIAIVVFLNDDIEGGELSFIDTGLDVVPSAGLLVAFDAGVTHEVRPVRRGTRDVIVDWFY